MTITWSICYCYRPWWNQWCQKNMYCSGHFYDLVGVAMQYDVHCPMEEVRGYTGSHWTPSSAKYFHRIALAAAMVIAFGSKKLVVALWSRCSKARFQKANKGPTNQLIKATSCVEKSNATIKAKELHNFSSYQMLITDINWWCYQAVMKLIEKLAAVTTNSC